MRKAIVILAAAWAAAQAAATDLDVSQAKGNAANFNPAGLGPDGFRKFWTDGTECYDYTLIDTVNNEWWTFANAVGKTYAAQMFRFCKPAGYETGTLRWRIRGESGLDVYLYRWRWDEDYFTEIDHNNGGSSPPTKEVTAPAAWFNPNEGVLFVMAVVETTAGHRAIDCDVLDIQW